MLVAFALAGCGGVAKQPAALEGGRPAASQAGPDAADQPSKTAADQARLNEHVSRIAGELSELQNAVAKLIASSRQQEDQLTFLRRRVEELESLNRGRLPAAPSGFAPSAPGGVAPLAPGGVAPPAPSPGPTPLASATTTPAAELYRAGTENLQAKDFDAAAWVTLHVRSGPGSASSRTTRRASRLARRESCSETRALRRGRRQRDGSPRPPPGG